MISLINYLNYKDDIKNMLIIAEYDTTTDLLLKLCRTSLGIEKMYIASTDKKRINRIQLAMKREAGLREFFCMPTVVPIHYKKTIDFEFSDKVDAILFDSSVQKAAIISVRYLQPTYLIGKSWRDFVPCFNIWEAYRSVSKHIHIECIGKHNKVDVIEWNQNPENDIELSVIFPVYNVAKYLPQCIHSVTAWKAPYVEFLFVNDGSPDNSRDIILEYQKQDPRIKLIDKPNGGCASARKRGMQEAKGRYIGFVDPDDFVDPYMFKHLFSRALIGSYDVSYSGYNAYYENSGKSERISDALGAPYVQGTTDKAAIQRLIMYLRVAIWRGIYRADFLTDNNITFQENLRRFDDLPFKVEVFAKAKSVVAVPKHLYYYRLERPGQDVACDDERLYVHFDIFEHLDKEISATKNQKLIDYLQLSKVQTHCFTLGKIQKPLIKEYCARAAKDFKQNNMSVWRTVLLILKYFKAANLGAFLSIMTHVPNVYVRYLEMKRVRK